MPNRTPVQVNAETALRAQATRTAAWLIKHRARAYAKRPMTLENVFPGLSAAAPETIIAVAKHLIATARHAPCRCLVLEGKSQSSTPRRFCFLRAPFAGPREGEPGCGRAIFERDLLERLSITWNHVIEKESLKINKLEQVLIEKVCQLFRDLL